MHGARSLTTKTELQVQQAGNQNKDKHCEAKTHFIKQLSPFHTQLSKGKETLYERGDRSHLRWYYSVSQTWENKGTVRASWHEE